MSRYDRFVKKQVEEIQSQHQSLRLSIEAKRSALRFTAARSALELRSSLKSQEQELRQSRERESSLRRTHVEMVRTMQKSASAQGLRMRISVKKSNG